MKKIFPGLEFGNTGITLGKMTGIQKIDKVLQWFAANPLAKGHSSYLNVYNYFRKEYPELKEQDDWGSELYRILDKLIKEGYVDSFESDVHEIGDNIDRITKQKNYFITFDGSLFITEIGGYQQRQRDKELADEKTRIENRQNRLNQKLLTWGAVGAAIGAIALVIWEMYKYYSLGCN